MVRRDFYHQNKIGINRHGRAYRNSNCLMKNGMGNVGPMRPDRLKPGEPAVLPAGRRADLAHGSERSLGSSGKAVERPCPSRRPVPVTPRAGLESLKGDGK